MNKHGEKFIFRGLFVTALVLGLSLTTYYPVQAAEVEEKNLSALPASAPTPAATPAATPNAMGPTAESPTTKAKEGFSSGAKGLGSGFKNGFKATGRGFKKAGSTMGHGFKAAGHGIGHGFKKFGGLIKGIFVRDKNKNEVQEKDLAAEGTNLAEENSALEAEEDLDAVGNEDSSDEV